MKLLPLLALLFAACHAAAPIEDDIVGLDPGSFRGDGSAVCPANLSDAIGTPCSAQGASCSDCKDSCQFCHILQCDDGTWTDIEAFPASCDAGGTD